jgi:uncharacterized SAM-binding protein YcdF (DUF218 family)
MARTSPIRIVVFGVPCLLAAWAAAWGPAAWLVVGRAVPAADVIVVLGGSKGYQERARQAAEIWRQGRASLVVINDDRGFQGWSNADERNLMAVERTTRLLRSERVPAEDILVLA